MTAFTIKVPDALHDEMERHLRTTGKTRSAFVRELIERELRDQARAAAVLRARVMALAGSAGGDADAGSSRVANHVNETLLKEGYGE